MNTAPTATKTLTVIGSTGLVGAQLGRRGPDASLTRSAGRVAPDGGESRQGERPVAWTAQQVDRFLAETANHRWAIAFRLGVLYGLRRSEVLTLRWDDLDTDQQTLRIDESLVATNEGAAWGNVKNERSRPTMCRHPCVDEQHDRQPDRSSPTASRPKASRFYGNGSHPSGLHRIADAGRSRSQSVRKAQRVWMTATAEAIVTPRAANGQLAALGRCGATAGAEAEPNS